MEGGRMGWVLQWQILVLREEVARVMRSTGEVEREEKGCNEGKQGTVVVVKEG